MQVVAAVGHGLLTLLVLAVLVVAVQEEAELAERTVMEQRELQIQAVVVVEQGKGQTPQLLRLALAALASSS